MRRKAFSEIGLFEQFRFDSGYYMTGHITRNIGTYNGKRMVLFYSDKTMKESVISYAAHRSVVIEEDCPCCDFGAHYMPCKCDGKKCCHPENH